MDITHNIPVAGTNFEVKLKPAPAFAIKSVKVFIDGKNVYDDECKDPPCHDLEQIDFPLPVNTGNKTLVIDVQKFNIASPDMKLVKESFEFKIDPPHFNL